MRLRVQRVVRALAELRSDRVDRGKVDDVEAHVGDGRQALHRTSERSRLGCATPHRVMRRALRAGEQLIPRAVQRPLAVDEQRVPLARRHVIAQRVALEQLVDLVGVGGLEAHDRRDRRLAQRARHRPQGLAARGGRSLGQPLGRAFEEACALLQHEFGVLPARDLDAGVVPPVRDRIAPCLHPEVPQSGGGRRDLGGVPVGAGGHLAQPGERALAALGITQDDARAEHLVAFAEHRGGDLEGLAGDGLRGPATAVDHRLYVEDGNSSDHRRRAYRRLRGAGLVFGNK